MQDKIEAIVNWIKEQINQAQAKGVVVGLSGGIDSSCVAALCKRAFPNNTLGVIMPCASHPDDRKYAELLAQKLEIPYQVIDLEETFKVICKTINPEPNYEPKNLTLANIKPRLRMITLYYFAHKFNYLVAGTDNKSEAMIGYFTKHGDGGVDFLPIVDLYKRDIRKLAQALNLPEEIIARKPSAGLWEGQTDEGELGISYNELDAILEKIELGQNLRDLDAEKVEKVKKLILNSEHKRKLPPACKLTKEDENILQENKEKNTEKRKIALVTGGAGFIGSHLVEALVERGYFVKVLDSLIKGKLKSIQHLIEQGKVEFIEGDLRNRDTVDQALKKVDYVFHTAGIHIIKSVASPEEAIDVNVKGSYNIFRSALEHKVKRVIFSSSSSIYGEPKVLPMKEDSEMNIVEPYGASKLMGENLLHYLGKQGLKYNILRYFNVYGSRQAVHAYYTTVVIHFINRILNNEAPIIDGKGDQSLDFTHVSDVVEGNILAAESSAENEIFNIGTGRSTSIAELANIIIKALGKDLTPQFRERKVFVSRRQACTEKAERLLGFKAKVSVEEGMFRVTREIAEHLDQYSERN